ncbi:MAG TPA: GNAT family N-acetyltransferase [Casimicrobiaceae bacterium]|nr:GNAT family N-acetyltransferase [Casimicrobiaceae bacterium]
MTDMLVKLYDLPPLPDVVLAAGVGLRRALVPEKPIVVDWTRRVFPGWAAEVEAAFARVPVACLVAVAGNELLGFACHDVVCRNFFGPTGVAPEARHRGIGRALLIATLHAQRELGYAYAIIAGVGPEAFYREAVGAIAIPGSTPGIYAGMLRKA